MAGMLLCYTEQNWIGAGSGDEVTGVAPLFDMLTMPKVLNFRGGELARFEPALGASGIV
jgi:hypothetical protein